MYNISISIYQKVFKVKIAPYDLHDIIPSAYVFDRLHSDILPTWLEGYIVVSPFRMCRIRSSFSFMSESVTFGRFLSKLSLM